MCNIGNTSIRKGLRVLMFIGALSICLSIYSCIRTAYTQEQDYQEFAQNKAKYNKLRMRGQVSDSVYLYYTDLEAIADILKEKKETQEQEKENRLKMERILYSTVGTVISLLLGGLLWFLKKQLEVNTQDAKERELLRNEMIELRVAIVQVKDHQESSKENCNNNHSTINHRLKRLEDGKGI